jgi:hypothetical protein
MHAYINCVHISNLVSLFSNNKNRLMRSPCCLRLCVYPPPLNNFWMPCYVIMAREPVSTTYFINPSHQSLCLYVYSFIVVGERLGKTVTAATNTQATRILSGVVFYAIRVLSKESSRLVFLLLIKYVFVYEIVLCYREQYTYAPQHEYFRILYA